MTTLKNLLSESVALENKLIELAGELTPELEESLSQLEIKVPAKVTNYMSLLDRLEMEAENLFKKAKKYEAAAKALTGLQDRLTSNVKHNMIEHNLTELRGIDESFVLTKGKKAVEVVDVSKLPRSFIVTTISERPEKDKIYEAFSRGEIVPGVEMRDTMRLTRKVNKTK